MAEAPSPCRSHKALGVRVLARRLWGRERLLDADALDTTAKLVTLDAVAVTDHAPGRRVLGEGFDDLLARPSRTRDLGDVEMKNAPAIAGQDEEDVEDAEGRRGQGEEIDRG